MPHPEYANPEPEPQTISEYTYAFASPGTEPLAHAWRSMMLGVLAQHLYDPETGNVQYSGISSDNLNGTLADAVVAGYIEAENPEKMPQSSLQRLVAGIRTFSISDWERYRRLSWKHIVYPKV